MRYNTLSITGNVSEFTEDELDELEDCEHLYVTDTNMTELPELPSGLEILYCNNNKLESLPELIECDLTHIYCQHNKLTELPPLPNIGVLNASYNKLDFFPDLPNNIGELYLSHNPFTKKKSELIKYKQYIRDNPFCMHDFEDIMSKGHVSLKLTSKKRALTKMPNVRLPNELHNSISQFLYNKKEDPLNKGYRSLKMTTKQRFPLTSKFPLNMRGTRNKETIHKKITNYLRNAGKKSRKKSRKH